jgi:hypothetical protein
MPDQHRQLAISGDGDDPRAAPTFLIGIIGTILVIVTIFLLEALYHNTIVAERERKDAANPPAQIRELDAAQRRMLSDYRVIDAENDIVAIPIERAMELVVEESNGIAE